MIYKTLHISGFAFLINGFKVQIYVELEDGPHQYAQVVGDHLAEQLVNLALPRLAS